MKALLSTYKGKAGLILFLSFVIAGAFLITSDSTGRLSAPSIEKAIAAPPPSGQLCGFAWGATSQSPAGRSGAGWISMNSRDCDFLPDNGNGTFGDGVVTAAEASQRPGCPVGNIGTYNVSVAQGGGDTRQMNGYAWSSNLGWLKFGNGNIILRTGATLSDGFGELSGMPNVSGYSQQQARISNAGNQISDVYGWARFCVATVGRDCSSMVADTVNTGGWDGWVALSESNGYPFSVQYNPDVNKFLGWSWGGAFDATVGATTSPVGWIKWNPTDQNSVQYCFVSSIDVSLTASQTHNEVVPEYEESFTPTLTAAVTPAGSGTQYKFSCDYGATFSDFSSDNTYDDCTYPIGGEVLTRTYYYPQVVGTRVVSGSPAYATTSTEIYVDPRQQPNDLGAICSVTPNPVKLNNPSTWNVELTNPGAQGNMYRYTFIFGDGQPEPTPIETTSLNASVNRTFRSLGNKSVTVRVVDLTAPNQTPGFCTAQVRVVINPVINER
jgi:hypothetical protein